MKPHNRAVQGWACLKHSQPSPFVADALLALQRWDGATLDYLLHRLWLESDGAANPHKFNFALPHLLADRRWFQANCCSKFCYV